jgi:small-conductance mechanosensitive channel
MNEHPWLGVFARSFDQIRQALVGFLPNLVGAVLIFLVGLLAAYTTRSIAKRLLRNVGRLIPNRRVREGIHPEGMERSAEVISKVLYWIILFFFLTAATEVLGLPVVTTWLSGVAVYLPKALVAILIGAVGVIGGMIVRDVVAGAAESAGMHYGHTLGSLAYYAVLIVTLFVCIQQIGVDLRFLMVLVTILLSGTFLAFALAFGMGARTSVSNILASHYLKRMYKEGHNVRIDGLEGRIERITPVSVILATPEGRACIPAKQFDERVSVLVEGGTSHGQ